MQNAEWRMQNALFVIYTHDDVFPVSVGTPYMASAYERADLDAMYAVPTV